MPARHQGRTRQLDYKSQQPLGHAPKGGAIPSSELRGALALRLGNACDQSRGGSRCVPMGAGRSPPSPTSEPRQKRDPGLLREVGALRVVGRESGPVEGARRTDFRGEVSGGRLLSREGPHLPQELPASPPPRTRNHLSRRGLSAHAPLPAPTWKFWGSLL